MLKFRNFQNLKNVRPNIFSTKKCSIKMFDHIFFRRKFFRPTIFWSPISIPNFPKIPKITLRKSCDELNDAKNRKPESFLQKCSRFFAHLVNVMHNSRGDLELGRDFLENSSRGKNSGSSPIDRIDF